MENILIPSYKSNLSVFKPKPLGSRDIAVQYAGSWYLVGEMAQIENANAERMQHGDFSSMEVQLLAKAAAAKAVGREGKIEVDVAVAAPLKSIESFRVGPGETRLKDDQFKLLQEALSHIEYRDENTHSAPKVLEIKIKNAHVLNELVAVLEIIPDTYLKYGLIQWGHGDLQMVSINEGDVVGEPFFAHGLWSAVRQFQKLTGLKPSEAQKAFREGYRYNGNMQAKVSCETEIRQAIKHHIMTDISAVLNNLAQQNQRNIIVSGGTVHNKVAMELLTKECEVRDMMLHNIQDLEGVNVDPVYTCLAGLKGFGTLLLDIGHSSLKAHMGVDIG